MLPFTKRAIRAEDDAINTGDFEVVGGPGKPASGRSPSSFPPPSLSRPRVFARSVSDEEMTTLIPRKGMTFSSRPPAITPVPMAKSPSSRPRAVLEEPPTRQFVKPSSPPPPPSLSPVAGPPRPSNRPPAVEPQHARMAMRPQPVPVRSEHLKSDPTIDPPATVITARTRIVTARPTMSWAAALVAMGVFVGLVTAVVARGDADTLIDAAASFVDPSGDHAAAAGATLIAVRTKAESSRHSLASTMDALVAPESAAAEARIATVEPAVLPARRPAPVAYAAPVHHASRPAAARVLAARADKAEKAEKSDKSDERVAAAAAPKATPKVAASKHADEDDMSGASAADALAKAQLEASLQ